MQCLRLTPLVLVLASSASAQLTFTDGFEGNLTQSETPAGVWDYVSPAFPNQQMVVSTAARRRGATGLQANDSHSATGGPGSQLVLGRNNSGAGSQYVRVWWRIGTSNAFSTGISFLAVQGDIPVGTLGELAWNPATNVFRLNCFDRSSGYFGPPAMVPMTVGGDFALVELALMNVGSGAGLCAFAVNGQELARQPIDWLNVQFRNVLIGPIYGDNGWVGRMDYDEFAASPLPMASRLEVQPRLLREGRCEQLNVRTLSAFTGAPAPVSTATSVTFRVDGGTLFSDSACLTTVGTSTVMVAAGSSTATFQVRALAPALVVDVVSDDLISSRAVVPVASPDGGPDGGSDAGSNLDGGLDGGSDAGSIVDGGLDGGSDAGSFVDGGLDAGGAEPADAGRASERMTYAVGCGCSETNGLALLVLAVLGLRRVRAGTSSESSSPELPTTS